MNEGGKRSLGLSLTKGARLLDSSAAPMYRCELPMEVERCRPRPSMASPSLRLSQGPAPRKIHSEMTLAAPPQPGGIHAAPAGSMKSNATDSTPAIGSPSSTIPFGNMYLSNRCCMLTRKMAQANPCPRRPVLSIPVRLNSRPVLQNRQRESGFYHAFKCRSITNSPRLILCVLSPPTTGCLL